MKYCTVQSLQRFSLGVDLSQLGTDEIGQAIVVAEGLVDAFCRTQHQPRPWHQTSLWPRGSLIFSIDSWPCPVVSIDDCSIQMSTVGPVYNQALDTDSVFVENESGHFSIVSLQTPYWSIPRVALDYHTSWALPEYNETLLVQSDGLTYYSSRPFWIETYTSTVNISPYIEPPVPPVIYINDAIQSSGYTIDYLNGNVIFDTPPSGTVTADYTSSIPDPVREGTRMTAVQLLVESSPNRAGLAGFSSLSLAGQLSGSARDQQMGLSKTVEVLLQPFRKTGII